MGNVHVEPGRHGFSRLTIEGGGGNKRGLERKKGGRWVAYGWESGVDKDRDVFFPRASAHFAGEPRNGQRGRPPVEGLLQQLPAMSPDEAAVAMRGGVG